MNKDKIITEALNEYYNTSVGPIAHGYSGEISLSNLGDPQVIDTINGIISRNTDLVFLNPQVAVERIRNRLRILGVDFGTVEIHGSEGMTKTPISQWSRYGFTDMDGNVKSDGWNFTQSSWWFEYRVSLGSSKGYVDCGC
ncbi:MAG: hypothetical protein HC894_06850 [Microcoleus sp. SM1_3_4]|nr:hypothetical protein [Microcoleus sp. SM1_3_4]